MRQREREGGGEMVKESEGQLHEEERKRGKGGER